MELDRTLVQKTSTVVTEHFIEHGHAPHYTELAQMLSVDLAHAKAYLHKAAEVGVGRWMAYKTDLVESWAPFHNIPTHYKITIDGEQKWYGQWGLESLAVRWLFPGKEVRLDVPCLCCGEMMTIRMKDEEILEVTPDTMVGHMNVSFAAIGSGKAPIGYAWAQMNLFRSEEHVKALPEYDPISEESIMPLADWAHVFASPLFRNRMEPDNLARQREDSADFVKRLAELGKSGDFWFPHRDG